MEHSENFELVKYYYENHFWNEKRVRRAVGHWITEAECAEILGESQK